uniref:Peptidase C1A papain C-terminal domain-containing protein n=1 Tax=Strigamia maritima TaxID=126957 RepID=T1INL7_STRMM
MTLLILLPFLLISGSFSFSVSVTTIPTPTTTSTGPPPKPTIPAIYEAEGQILLPYAEIIEPFTAYFDGKNNKSRIDYYGGTVVTYQRADIKPYGVNQKLVYTSATERNCFQQNGTVNATATTQTVFPDLTQSNYTYEGPYTFNNQTYDIWKFLHRDSNGPDKLNTYRLWMTTGKNPLPARFQMMGANTVFGSHFDKYEVVYSKVQVLKTIDPKTFAVPTNYTCTGFPGPGKMLFNPMQEFINNDDSHVDESFAEFKDNHNRVYRSKTEHEERKNNFRHNLRFIHSTNRQGNSFTLAVNHLADRTDEEMRILRGKQRSNSEFNGGLPFPPHDVSDLPDSLDWRLYGAVTPVKDQAICGSCWSFGTTGTIEGAYFVHLLIQQTGHLVRLSQQALIDCSWKFGNNGCDGGEDFRAYQWIMNGTGLPLADSYGPYLGQDGICSDTSKTETVKITGYVNITSGDREALRAAMFSHGPISVSIDASHKTFGFYSSGVYYDPKCRNDEDGLDHSVLAVGFGIMNGERYWLVKNSWSTYWGNDGYVLMSQKNNNCGVATSATYVTFD